MSKRHHHIHLRNRRKQLERREMSAIEIAGFGEHELERHRPRLTLHLQNLKIRAFGNTEQCLDIAHLDLTLCILRKFLEVAPLLGRHRILDELHQVLLEEIVDFEFRQVLELFTAFGIQHNRRGKVLAAPHHRDHAYILYQARLLQAIFYFRERNSFFLDFHDGVGAALQQETPVVVDFHEVARRKTFGFQNVARLHVQAVVFANAHLADFKRFPNGAVLGLPVGYATGLGTAIDFCGPVARDAFALAGHLFGKRAARRIDNRCILELNRLFGIGGETLQVSRARRDYRLFTGQANEFARIVDAVSTERKPRRRRQ